MMRAPAALVTSVLPSAPVVSSAATSTPNTDLRSTEMKTAVRASGRIDPPARNAQASMNDSLAVSMSTVPRRRIGVFLAALLIFDAGLATAGALMMRSALGRASGATAAPTVPPTVPPEGSGSAATPAAAVPSQPSNPPKGSPVAVPAGTASADADLSAAGSGTGGGGSGGSASAVQGPSGALGGAGANVQISPDKTSPAPKDRDKGGKGPDPKTGVGPVDPYATPAAVPPVPPPGGSDLPVPTPTPVPTGEQTAEEESLADQVRRREAGSRARFARCYSIAAKASDIPLVGSVTVAFQVTAQGRVSNANAVDNSTESLSLARCVVAEVSKWTFAAGAGDAQDFVRVFKFEGQ
jgi:hypothetical protein